MTFDDDTILAAFGQHQTRYAKGEAAWDVPYHVGMWQTARKAVEGRSFADFETVYKELKNRWQVFRGAKRFWTARQTFDRLMALDARYATRCLSTLSAADLQDVWTLLQAMQDVKKTKDGPSVVAVSKFLHFWNPGLFVIVDYGVVWSHVFGHWWLWQPFLSTRERVDKQVFGKAQKHADATCDLSSYLAVLAWAAELARDNPRIVECFAEYVARNRGTAALPADLSAYDAAAVEWFLLGVVELPPPGLTYS